MATSIRLAPETEQRLDFLASSTGRTKAYYLREIIDHGLTDLGSVRKVLSQAPHSAGQ